jgi:hypothetical protein
MRLVTDEAFREDFMGRTRFPRLLLFVIALVLSAICWAQVTTATLGGTVTDPTGAITPGARVTVTQQETGATKR